ncbi:hypothetical protein [Paenibacillus roseipurpureus]|uniref:Uncharacterized protein n=1 Tax=Paenibacillus roseopurpureus TaxID=2918901 RepID=A0AA96RLC8_9BACL|nr:hypothetical protein [Paenibacillus sp. MBLB1832]WNR45231.1 hypothetical protein MJB10_03595 [Paenibacillus sp. MBLB1832]
MSSWLQEILTHLAAFLAGASISVFVYKNRSSNKSNYKVKQNNNIVLGDLTGRDKGAGK